MADRETCFYCGAIAAADAERDHFPIPRDAGGQSTVTACTSCHDMKDRFPLGVWPTEWVSKTISDFPKFSRETRLFLAKAMREMARVNIRGTT
jgi:5-methylcytosine-specific restriction endonuclease McrA